MSTGTSTSGRPGWAGTSVALGLVAIAGVIVIALFLWVDTGSPTPIKATGKVSATSDGGAPAGAGATTSPVDDGASPTGPISVAALSPSVTTGPVGTPKNGAPAPTAVDPVLEGKALKVLNAVDRTGKPPKGFQGGRTFQNDGRGGTWALPRKDAEGQQITYREYDVNAYRPGVNRGPQRLVIGSDRSAYCTGDHYVSWWRLR